MSSLGQVVSPQAKLGFGELTFNGIYLSKELFDISNLHIDTNFKPEVSFEDGIRETANWIAKNIN
jgi:UDP-glucose 4-epimerase